MNTTKVDKSAVVVTKNLDTDTVLEIIRLLDRRIDLPDHAYTTMGDSKWLIHFRDYLQDYIEARVSAMENSTPE